MGMIFNQVAISKRKLQQLEDRFKESKTEEERKWIFWEIEKTYLELNQYITKMAGKKNP